MLIKVLNLNLDGSLTCKQVSTNNIILVNPFKGVVDSEREAEKLIGKIFRVNSNSLNSQYGIYEPRSMFEL